MSLRLRLQACLLTEWKQHGFFPCYAAVLPQGDPDFHASDLWRFLRSPSDPLLRLATLLLWPARLARLPGPHPQTGLARRVPVESRFILRFHTFFTDCYFYTIIRKAILPHIPPEERRPWERILLGLVTNALAHRSYRILSGQTFRVYPFFPAETMHANRNAKWFLRWSGMQDIAPDADDTFMVLEMCADFLCLMDSGELSWLPPQQKQQLRSDINRLLQPAYWQLARAYQFHAHQVKVPVVNYTGVLLQGGVSTWFGLHPTDAPDLVVNVNVLRALVRNRGIWGILNTPEALDTVQGIVAFLHDNVTKGLFRQARAYSFYLPEFFVAMFAWLWEAWQEVPESEQHLLDPQARLSAIRQHVLAYLRDELHPQRNLNPMDAALALGAARRLEPHATRHTDWQRILEQNASPEGMPYPAYEIFKGKIPTHMVYGSPAITALFALDALSTQGG